MDIKGMLKNIDWKGIGLRHCEKAAIAIVTCLLVLFVVKGVQKSFSAGGIAPEEIATLAENLERQLAQSTWDESVAAREGIKNPDVRDQLDKLKTPVDTSDLVLGEKTLFWLPDFGRVLRQKPDILAPRDLFALSDRGAISFYKVDAKGKFVEKEHKVDLAQLPKKDEHEEKKKSGKKDTRPKSKSEMMERMKGGGDAGIGEMMRRRGGGMSGMPGMAMGPGGPGGAMMGGPGGMMGGPGAAAGPGGEGGAMAGGGLAGGDEDNDAGSMLRASQNLRSASTSRRPPSTKSRVARIEEEAVRNVKAKPGEKAPTSIKIKEEEIKGARWAVVTATFPYAEQVKEYAEKLNTRVLNQPAEYPEFSELKVERRFLQSDGVFSNWQSIDRKNYDKFLSRIPATEDPRRRDPEDETLRAANAIFKNLVMPLPMLEAGGWWGVDHEDAIEAAKNAITQVAGGRMNEDDEYGDDSGDLENMFGREEGALAGGGPGAGPMAAPGPSGAGGGVGAGGGGTPMPGAVGMSGGGGGVGASGLMGGPPGGSVPGGMMGGPGMGGGMGQQMGMLRGPGMGGGMGANQGLGAAVGGQNQGGTPAVQKKIQRTSAELVQVRFIDYSVKPEHTYQYRFKVVVNNPNFRHRNVFDPEFKKVEFLESNEWSEPSPPVFVPADIEYFVLEKTKAKEEAKIQVHDWRETLGDWNFKEFPNLKPGDPIGARVKEHPIVNWDGALVKTEYNFLTEDLLIDVTGGDRSFMFPGEDGRDVRYNEPLPAEIFVVDRLGELLTRNQDFDKNDITRKEREKYLNELKKEAQKKDEKGGEKKSGKPEAGSGDDFEEGLPTRKGGRSEP
jgi:hypothetical protein